MDTLNTGKKKCNFCGEDVSIDARRCPYCGSLLGAKVDEIKPPEIKFDETDVIEKVENIDQTPVPQDGTEQDSDEDFDIDTEKNLGNVNTTMGYATIAPKPDLSKPTSVQKGLTNAKKVALTTLAAIIPGIGQLIGIIISIVYMNTQDESAEADDKRSFGLALLIACLVAFVISCISCFMLGLAFSSTRT